MSFCEEPIEIEAWADPPYYHERLHQLMQDSMGAMEWLFFAGAPLTYIKKCLLMFTSREDATGGWECLKTKEKMKLGTLYRTQEKLKALPIWGTPQMVVKISETRASIIIQMLWEMLSQKHWMLTTIHQDKFESWFKGRGVAPELLRCG